MFFDAWFSGSSKAPNRFNTKRCALSRGWVQQHSTTMCLLERYTDRYISRTCNAGNSIRVDGNPAARLVRRFWLPGVPVYLFEFNLDGHGQPVDCDVVIDPLIIVIRCALGPLETVGSISSKMLCLGFDPTTESHHLPHHLKALAWPIRLSPANDIRSWNEAARCGALHSASDSPISSQCDTLERTSVDAL
jgi:hypothetical protein